MNGPLSGLAVMQDIRTKRISSYDRTGGNADSIRIEPGETVTIADIPGAGVIKHIWITVWHADPMFRRNMMMRMFWDGRKNPAVECPLGDFFGQGWGEEYNYVSLPLCAAPQNGRALNSYFPMPYADGARIEIENESDKECMAFYYYVDYEEHETIDDAQGRFHAFWNRTINYPAQGVENEWSCIFRPESKNLTDTANHLIIDTKGTGHYVGVNYYVDNPSTVWYGEGDDMWFIDGESWPPSLHGTGTEDYFNTSWCPRQKYQHPYFGYGRVNEAQTGWLGRTHVYRYHIEDPIRFTSSLRGSIEIGHANCVTADIITVAYWYQQPCAKLPKLPLAAKRQNMPQIEAVNVHRWREAYRYLHGKDVWGDEDFPKKAVKPLKERVKKKPLASPAAKQTAKKEEQKQQKMLNRRSKKKK
jgi:hypothetical protein